MIDRRGGSNGNRLLLAIAYVGFVSLGLPDAVSGVAWPSMRDTFSLSQSSIALLFLTVGCGYCTSSFFSGKLTATIGVGTLLALSTLLVAAAMLGNATAPAWPVIVCCGAVWGLGSGAIDSGLNAYVASNFSARHVNWLHACYSLGATLGPLLMTAMLVRTGSWRPGYALVGGLVLAMFILFLVTRHRWVEIATPLPCREGLGEGQVLDIGSSQTIRIRIALRHPLIRLQAVIFFLYTGLEFTVGQWAFTIFTESRAVETAAAGILTGVYFGAIGVGRVLFGAVVNRFGPDRIVRVSMLAALLGTAVFAFGRPVEVSYFGLAVIGLGLAPVFPCLMARTPQRMGADFASHAIGFQVSAAMLGVAVVPAIAGLMAERLGLEAVARFAVGLMGLLLVSHELLIYRTKDRANGSSL